VLCYIGQLRNGIDVGHDIFSCLRTAAVCSQILDCYYFNYVAAAARCQEEKRELLCVCVPNIRLRSRKVSQVCNQTIRRLLSSPSAEKKRVPLFHPFAVGVPLVPRDKNFTF
jgi:hypothetical protein